MTGDKQHDATAELNEALTAAFAAGDFDALAPFYTEDATLMPPRGKLLQGRAAVPAFWRGVSNRFRSVAFTTLGLKQLGDAARREAGTYAMGSGEGQTAEGKYVFVWQLVDGDWQIESGIWNRSGEPGGNRRQGQARQGAGGGGYRQGARPSFQAGRGGAGGRPGGGQGGLGQRGRGQGGQGQGRAGGGLYEGDAGLYSDPNG